MRGMGFFAPVPVELPEAARPLVPHQWSISTTMTVGFGHGMAEPPLAIVRGTAATVNGGILLKPTLLEREDSAAAIVGNAPDATPTADQDKTLADGVQNAAFAQAAAAATAPTPANAASKPTSSDEEALPAPEGTRVLSEKNSALLRRLLRLDVTAGTGRTAESPGYFVGGKTGTAEKIGPHGGYLKHVNISAFTGIFPMNEPRYAVYVMLDSPKPTPQTHGWTTAGWNAAPTVSKIISRIGPMLQIFPDTAHAAQIDASMALPMHPPVPRGVRPLGPGNDPGDPRKAEAARKAEKAAEKQKLADLKKHGGEVMDE
jgi:cell division protein FtsI (penicillin-binding protein 3)